MALKKLTLSAPEEVIAETKLIVGKRKPRVSPFVRLFRTIDQEHDPESALGPIALRASGMVKLPTDGAERDVLEEALSEKYGLR